MTKQSLRLAGWASALLAITSPAVADVKVNENISVNGYAVGSYMTYDPDGGARRESFFETNQGVPLANADAVKLGVLATSGSYSAYGSVIYFPKAGDEAGLLDAYVTFDTGAGVKLTGGKFLSYLGYEAYDPINMAQLTYGSTIYAIPGYHNGVKLDYSSGPFSLGVAAVDSIFGDGTGFQQGDRDFDDDIGFEVIGTYTGIDKLTVFAGVAFEDTDGAADSLFIFDLWLSYAVSDKLTLAAEFDTQKDVMNGWLGFASYKFTDKFSTAFRISGVEWDGGGSDTKYTIAPTYTINSNFALRGEFSMGEGDSGDYTLFGAQVIFKF
jgi:hypothetical protein